MSPSSGCTTAEGQPGTGEVGPHTGRPTPLGDAIAHYGRIAKTLHILRAGRRTGRPGADQGPSEPPGGPPRALRDPRAEIPDQLADALSHSRG